MVNEEITIRKKIAFSLTGAVIFLSVIFIIAEFGVRFIGHHDEDGTFHVQGRRIKPYRLPVGSLDEQLASYLSKTSEGIGHGVYDPLVGWSLLPNGQSEDGLYKSNSAGIRSAPTEYSMSAKEGTLRIALFGDSFTEGAEVPFEDTWGVHLENDLKSRGVDAEVLNFGVSAYGMDQAILRWRYVGTNFAPHIVIFGLQMENTQRNISIFRPFYNPNSETIFTKPRFVLEEGNLNLVNSPTVPPENVSFVISNYEEWGFAEHDRFFNPEDYKNRFWLKSKSFATLLEVVSTLNKRLRQTSDSEAYYSLDSESGQLAIRIIQEFKRDVEEHDAEFLMVHLPTRGDVKRISNSQEPVYQQLLDKVKEIGQVIDPADQMIEAVGDSSIDDLFGDSHYSPKGNEIVGEVLANSIEARLKNRP